MSILAKRVWLFAIAVAAVLAVYLPPMLTGHFWAPGDGITQAYPQRAVAGYWLLRGEFPFWNPYIFGGMPFFATAHVGVLSPLNWPGELLGLAAGTNCTLLIGFAVLLAGFGVFCRTLGLSWGAASVAALIFSLGGFVTFYSGNPCILQTVALLPWLLAALERQRTTEMPRYLAGISLLTALIIFAGHPQSACYVLLLAGSYALVIGPGRFARVGALALGTGLALVQLLPTMALVASSQRRAIDYGWLTIYSVPPWTLPTHLFPYLFGSRVTDSVFTIPLWASIEWYGYLESYVGPVAWLLALTALGRRERRVRFWFAVAGLGLLLSLGRYTPIYHLWALLPFVNQMPYASRHALEMTFAVAMLAAYGFDWIARAPDAARLAFMRAGGVLFAGMLVVWLGLLFYAPGFAARTQPFIDQVSWAPKGLVLVDALKINNPAFWVPVLMLLLALNLGRRGRPVWLIPLLAMDLWSFNIHQGVSYILPTAPRDLPVSPGLAWNDGRSLTVSLTRYPDCQACDILGYLRERHYPDVSMLSGERTVNGYDAFLPARYGQLLGMDSFGHAGEYDASIWEFPHHALDLLGLGTLRLERGVAEQPEWRRRLASGRWETRAVTANLLEVHNPRALPQAWRVARYRQASSAEVDAAVAGKKPFAPRAEALVEVPVGYPQLAPGPVTIETPSLSRMTLQTDGGGPGLVVVSSGYDAGWEAQDELGKSLPVLRTDSILLGVTVPPGAHTVHLKYVPPRFWAGLAGSLVSGVLLLLWIGLNAKRRPPSIGYEACHAID